MDQKLGWPGFYTIALSLTRRVFAFNVPIYYNCEETWAVKKAHEKKMKVAEIKMLRWMCGVTRLDKIRNKKIRGSTKVGRDFKEGPRTQDAMVRACDEKRRGVRRKEGDGYRSTRKQKERKTEEVGGLCERRSERERTVRRGGVRPSCMEATIVPHRPHIEVG